MTAPHLHSSTPARRAFGGTTPSTPSAWHNGPAAPRAVEPHGHNEHWHDQPGTTGVPESRPTRHHQKGMPATLPSRPTVLPFSWPRAPTKTVNMPMISRAKRSAAWACSARWRVVPDCHPHPLPTPPWYHAGTTGDDLESPAARNHAQHDARSAQRASIPRLHNRRSAPRASVPRQHNERPAQRSPAQRAFIISS